MKEQIQKSLYSVECTFGLVWPNSLRQFTALVFFWRETEYQSEDLEKEGDSFYLWRNREQSMEYGSLCREGKLRETETNYPGGKWEEPFLYVQGTPVLGFC